MNLILPRLSRVKRVREIMWMRRGLYLLFVFLIINIYVLGGSNIVHLANSRAIELGINLKNFARSNLTLTFLPKGQTYHSNSKASFTMQYLITLHLQPPNNSLEYVKQLSGIRELEIDENYGLVLISPKRDLYVIRVSGDINPNHLMSIQPAVKGVHGDMQVRSFNS